MYEKLAFEFLYDFAAFLTQSENPRIRRLLAQPPWITQNFKPSSSRLLAQPPFAEAALAADWITAFFSQFFGQKIAKQSKYRTL